MFKKLVLLGLLSNSANCFADKITDIVEFFSFKCSHCASVNDRLTQYVSDNHIKFLDVNVDPGSMNTMIMYYVAVNAGVGVKFKQTYFKAVSQGMTAYSEDTLAYVVGLVKNDAMRHLIISKTERQRIKDKMNYAQSLLSRYKVSETPTFLINKTTLLSGEDVINQLGNE